MNGLARTAMAICLCLGAVSVTGAQDLRPLSTADVADLATRIVVARCTGVEVLTGAGGNIFTESSFQTVETIKGVIGPSFSLRLLGGTVGAVRIEAPNMPTFVAREEVVLFLGRDNAQGYPTIFPQAVFRVSGQGGVRLVEPAPTGLTLLRADGRPYETAPRVLPLSDFVHSLRTRRGIGRN